MRVTIQMLAVLLLAGLMGCANGFDLDPGPAHEFPKTDRRLTAPPADLVP
jgi:hypothetical protein